MAKATAQPCSSRRSLSSEGCVSFIRTVTVGSGIKPDLLTLPDLLSLPDMTPCRRSRALTIAGKYRR